MNRVYVNLGIGIFWLFAAGLCYLTGELNTALLAVCLILAAVYFWAAFKIFINPNLVKKRQEKPDPAGDRSKLQTVLEEKEIRTFAARTFRTGCFYAGFPGICFLGKVMLYYGYQISLGKL